MDTKLVIASKRTAGACGAGPDASHSTVARSCGHVLNQLDDNVLCSKLFLALDDACTG